MSNGMLEKEDARKALTAILALAKDGSIQVKHWICHKLDALKEKISKEDMKDVNISTLVAQVEAAIAPVSNANSCRSFPTYGGGSHKRKRKSKSKRRRKSKTKRRRKSKTKRRRRR